MEENQKEKATPEIQCEVEIERHERKTKKKETVSFGIFLACLMGIAVFLLLVPFVSIRTACLFFFPVGGLTVVGGAAFWLFCISVAEDPDSDSQNWTYQ